jgi:hypothetical protein
MYSAIWCLFYRIQIKPFLITLWQSDHRQLFVYWFTPFDLSIAAFIHYQDGSTLYISCHRGCELWSNTFSKHCRRVERDRGWDISDNFEAFDRIYNCMRLACVSLTSLNVIGNAWRVISQPIDLSKKTLHVTWPWRWLDRHSMTRTMPWKGLFAAFDRGDQTYLMKV